MITSLISTFFVAVALAMDAFSVSLTKGFTQRNLTKYQILYYGLFFGGFQFLMPFLGYFCGKSVSFLISTIAPWIAFILLVSIGLNMIRESLSSNDEDVIHEFSFKETILLAIATSIDAFAVGLSYAFLGNEIIIPSVIIGIVAFLFSIFGVFIGKKVGNYFGDKFEIIGGIILVLIGILTLLGF